MKCPNCGNEMVESRAGHLCISCGHIETSTAKTVADSNIATGKDSHDQMAAANSDTTATPDPTPTQDPAPADSAPSSDASTSDTPSSDAPADSSTTDAPSTDEPSSDTDTTEPPAPPVTAAPWEAPATDAKPTEPKPSEESDDTSIKITTPDEKPSDAPEPTPSAEDISAVEKAVAEAAKAAGTAPTEEPADEPNDEEIKSDESKDESKESEAEPVKDEDVKEPEVKDEPKEDEIKSDSETIVPLAEGVAGAAVAAETSEASILKHHKVKRHPKHKKDEDKEDKKEEEKPEDKDEQPKEDKPHESSLTHKDLKLDAPDKIEDKPEEEKPAEPKEPEAPATTGNYSQNTHVTPTPAWMIQAEAKAEPDQNTEPVANDDAPKEETGSGSEALPINETESQKSDIPSDEEKPDGATEPESEPETETDKSDEKPVDDPDEPKEDEPKEDEPSPVVIPAGPDAATTPDSMLTPPAEPSTEQPLADQPAQIPTPTPADPQPPMPPVVASNAPLNGKPPLTPTTHPRPVTGKLVISLIAGVLIAGAAAGGVYAYKAAPKLALASYLQKIVDSKTNSFTLTSAQSGDGYQLALKLTGKSDVTDTKNPKFDASVTGQLSSDKPLISDKAPNGGLGGHAVLVDKAFYFKLDDPSILNSIVNTKPTSDWYRLDLSKATQSNKCSDQTSGISAIMSKDVLENIPVKDAKLTGMSKLDGSKAMHYTGTVDNSKLQSVIDSTNQKLSADCKLDIKPADYQNQTIKYELWRGWSKDRLKLTMTDSSKKVSGIVTLDTSDYKKPVDIKAPAGAKDAAELFKGVAVLGAATQAVDAPAATVVTTSATSNDAKRQSDLALYAAAYKVKAKNGFFAVNPPSVQVNATDPTTGQSYVISKAAPTTPGQIQYKPGGSCTGPSHTPGATGTRYLALYTMLEGTSTPYCLDVK